MRKPLRVSSGRAQRFSLGAVALASAFWGLCLTASGADWYVDALGNCPGSGSAADPFCLINDALTAATAGDTILVAPGSYNETLDVRKDLTFLATGAPGTTSVLGDFFVLMGATVAVDGFDVQMFQVTSSTLTLANSTISGAGSVSNNYGTTIIENSVLTNNSPLIRSGAVYNKFGVVEVIDSQILNNSMSGVKNFYGDVTIRNTTISGNQASNGGGIYNLGHWLHGASVLIYNSTIDSNGSSSYGGGLFNYGISGYYLTPQGNISAYNTTISGNTADYGGGMYSILPSSFTDCTFANNQAVSGPGGAIQLDSALTLTRCTLRDNYAYYDGGAIYSRGQMTITDTEIVDNTTLSSGGGIYNWGSMTLRHSTVASNSASSSGGVATQTSSVANIIGHSIIARNTGGFYPDIDTGYNAIAPNLIGGTPRFVDRTNGDYRLKSISPAIDAGDPAFLSLETDRTGNCRLLDGDLDGSMIVDLGAHEFAHARLEVTGNPTPGGSIDVTVTGTAGMLTFLWVAGATDALLFPPYGCFLVDLNAGASILVNLGVAPVPVLNGTLPSNLPIGTTLALQAHALSAGVGNLSNLEVLVLE